LEVEIERGTDFGGVKAMLLKEESGVRTTDGDATFGADGTVDGVIGERGNIDDDFVRDARTGVPGC
jgi:hypothetical protein